MSRAATVRRLRDAAERLRSAREPGKAQDPAEASRLAALRRWQADRLALSFAPLLASPRHGEAARFFLSDLYGEQDASWRDRDLARAMGMLTRWLPGPLLGTLADAVELDLASHVLDSRVAEQLERAGIAPESMQVHDYAAAYRSAGTEAERVRQLDLLMSVGRDLDRVVRLPFIGSLLHLAKLPAEGAGMGELHGFLERGFAAFRSMGGACEFLATIDSGEREAMQRMLRGEREPFGVGFAARLEASRSSRKS